VPRALTEEKWKRSQKIQAPLDDSKLRLMNRNDDLPCP